MISCKHFLSFLNNDIKKPNPKIDIDKIDALNLTIAFLYEILLPLISTIFIFHDFIPRVAVLFTQNHTKKYWIIK